MALPRSRSYLGIAKETRVAGGSVPSGVAPTDFIPFTSFTPFDNIKYLDDKGIRGSMTEEYGVIQGNYHSELDFAGDVFPDLMPYMFNGILGDSAYTGVSAPYTYTHALLNSQADGAQPKSYTLTDYYSGGSTSSRQFVGCQFSGVDIKFTADALMTYTAKAMGFASTGASRTLVTNPTLSLPYPQTTPLPSWTGTVTIDGSSIALLADGDVSIQRSINPIFTVDGSQDPYQLFAGPVTVGGTMKLVYNSDTQLNYYLQNTQPSLVVDFTSGTGGSAVGVKFTMSRAAFTVGRIDRSKDYIELDLTYKAIANTTDAGTSGGYSPVKVTVKNAVNPTVTNRFF